MSSESNSTNPSIAFSEQSAEIVANVGKSIVAINRQRFSCSGIYWRDGLIVTSEESLKRTENITITLPNRETKPVIPILENKTTDKR